MGVSFLFSFAFRSLLFLLFVRPIQTSILPFCTFCITWPTKVHLVKAMVFLVIMCGCESWTIKKVEHRRNDAFELWFGEDS